MLILGTSEAAIILRLASGILRGAFYGLKVPKARAPEPRPRQMELWFLEDPTIQGTPFVLRPALAPLCDAVDWHPLWFDRIYILAGW